MNLTIINARVQAMALYDLHIHALPQPMLERDDRSGKGKR
jgi:hypothetical protein